MERKRMMNTPATPSDLELNEREQRFVKRVALKYSGGGLKPLLRSLAIFTLLIAAGHAIVRTSLPWWGTFPIVYLPALYLFGRYRKMGTFKMQLLRKLALRSNPPNVDPTSTEKMNVEQTGSAVQLAHRA
jgi:hypothetical protein